MDAQTIESLANWSKPKEIQTKYGPRMLRKAAVTETFSAQWKARKEEIKELGASFTRDERSGEWELVWWQKIDAETQAKRDEAVSASKATSAAIDLPHPAGLDYMPFQKAGIQYALAHTGTLIADEMGLGKTIQAIGVINSDPTIETAIVICPKSLKLNWQRELERWLTRPLTIGVANGSWPETQIVILNYEALGKHIEKINAQQWSLCIVDEVHYIKNKKAQRSKFVKSIKAARHLRLTGTPIVNRPVELQNIIDDLNPAFAGFGFLKRYCDAHQNGFGWDFSGASNLDELQRRLRETCMVRRLKADVLTELPRKIRQIVELEPDSAATRKAVQAEDRFESANDEQVAELRAAVELAKTDSKEAYEAAVGRLSAAQRVAFEEISRLRHETAVAKLPQVLQHITEALEDDDSKKIIIAAHHHDVIDSLYESAQSNGWNPVKLTGRNNETERLAAVDAFQNDPSVRVFIGSIQAAGVGITLTASSHVIFAELDWVPGNISQFEDRAHRIGQTDTVLVQHIVLNGSLDARMAHLLVEKQRVIDSALDVNHPDRQEPVYQSREVAASHNIKTDELSALADTLTDDQRTAVHTALRILANLDPDHAAGLNDVGFNKIDSRIGHELAQREMLTPKQAALGMKIIKKYHRQLPDEIKEAVK